MKGLLLAVLCSALVIISTGEKAKRNSDGSKPSLLGLPDGHDDRKDQDDGSDILGAIDEKENEEIKDSEYEYPKSVKDTDGTSEAEYSEYGGNYEEETENENKDIEAENVEEETDLYLPGIDKSQEEDDTPLVRCKRPLCRMFCSSGFKTDNAGCPLCECLEDPCELMDCVRGSKCVPSECHAGTSCVALTAQCLPDQSEPVKCPMMKCVPCTTGYQLDERGCQTCKCLKGCSGPEPMCASDCADLGGYKYTEEGCMTCDCNMNISPVVEIEDGKMPCAVPSCDTDCFGNYKYNDDGCMTCECLEAESLIASICNTQNAVYLVALAGILAIIMLLTTIIITIKIIRRRRVRAYKHRLLETQISTNSQKSLLKDDGCVSVSMSDDKPLDEKHTYA